MKVFSKKKICRLQTSLTAHSIVLEEAQCCGELWRQTVSSPQFLLSWFISAFPLHSLFTKATANCSYFNCMQDNKTGSSTNLLQCFLLSGLFILPAPGFRFFHFLGSCSLFYLLLCQSFFPHLKHTQQDECLSFRLDNVLCVNYSGSMS